MLTHQRKRYPMTIGLTPVYKREWSVFILNVYASLSVEKGVGFGITL